MFATRWGDQHAMAKSFVLSMLLHLCLGLGWATVVENQPLPIDPPGEPAPIPIRQVMNESPDEFSQPESGNTPIWQKPLDVPAPEVQRTTRETARVPLEAPERMQAEPTASLPAAMAQLPTPADEPQAVPQTTAAPASAPATDIAPSALAPSTSAEARTETGAVAATASRPPLPRPPQADEPPLDDSRQGAAQRTATTPDAAAMSLPLPLDQSPSLPKAIGTPADAVARNASPAAVPLDDPTVGAPLSNAESPSMAAPAAGPRFTRATRAPGRANPSFGEVARVETPRMKSDLNSQRLRALGERVGSDADSPQPEIIPSRPKDMAIGSRAQAATTYRLRRLDRRKEIALRNGGSEDSEKAVELALAYLARMQEPAGFWDADRHGGGLKEVRQIDPGQPAGGAQTDTGVTGLAVLAYLGAGHTHDEGNYQQTVRGALDWLIAQQRSDGYLGGAATYYDQMYCHGIAVYALAEAYGMQADPSEFPALREAVTRGVWYITQTQNSDGGWRYRVGASLSDMSIFGWQLMALKSAELAGIATPSSTRSGMIQFLRERSRGMSGGLAGYKQDSPPTAPMTAEALFCKQISGLRRTSPASQEAVTYLQASLPQLSRPDEYYWYYGTMAMFQHGGEPWEAWNTAMRDTLVQLQRKGNIQTGSWDPVGQWGGVGGRIYSTAVSTLCLEVYYRFLPLYQMSAE